MDIEDFVTWWAGRDRAGLERMIEAVVSAGDGSAVDVVRRRARAEVDVALRRAGHSRLGGRAAHRARQAVVDVCRRHGLLGADHAGTVRLARAAGDAARALVCDVRACVCEELLSPFRAELPSDVVCGRPPIDVAS